MKGKKAFLAGWLHCSGCLRLLRGAGRGRLVVFAYHRIRPDGAAADHPFDDGVVGPTASVFAKQVAWLRRQTRVLSEDDLLQIIALGRAPDGLNTMITFDDGYRDNYTLALPILRQMGVPAMFFIPTQPIETRTLGWWDVIAYVIKRTTRPSVALEGVQVDLAGRPREEAIRTLQRLMKTRPAQTTASLAGRLAEACGVPLPSPQAQDREIMTWDHIRELAAQGFGIGSHTHTHRVLATLGAQEQEEELRRSKAVIERQIGREVRSLAYPVGGYAHFTLETQALAARCGYALGFSFNTFVNQPGPVNRFDIKRIEGPRSAELLAAASVLPEVFARWN